MPFGVAAILCLFRGDGGSCGGRGKRNILALFGCDFDCFEDEVEKGGRCFWKSGNLFKVPQFFIDELLDNFIDDSRK